MRPTSEIIQSIPFKIVGSSTFGRYPKISVEKTYNQIVSDGWLVPYAGYEKVVDIAQSAEGRGLEVSVRFNHMICVVNNSVYIIDNNLFATKVGELDTGSGDVFIAENNGNQFALCDKESLYIYNYDTDVFQKATLDFTPSYVYFQDGYFVAGIKDQPKWRLSDPNNGLNWPAAPPNVGTFQTDADDVVATVGIRGKGGLLFIFGKTITESWYNTGTGTFPYQRSSFTNIDFGCLNPASVDSHNGIIVWLAQNKNSGTTILFSNGTDINQVSTEGINYLFATLTNPQNCYGFLFKQDGHLIYQFTFPDDNLSMAYDFTTQQFFHLCDEFMNIHIAKRVVFFNGQYYFISFTDGNIYNFSTAITTYAGKPIQRLRTTSHVMLPDSSRFIVTGISFQIEQGQSNDIQSIYLSLSKDGGESFGSAVRKDLNPIGKRMSMMRFWNMGAGNDFVFQFRFTGLGRFVIGDGELNFYQ